MAHNLGWSSLCDLYMIMVQVKCSFSRNHSLNFEFQGFLGQWNAVQSFHYTVSRQLRTAFSQIVLLVCNGLLSCGVEYRFLVKRTFIIFSICNDFYHGITHPKLKNSYGYKTNTLFSLI